MLWSNFFFFLVQGEGVKNVQILKIFRFLFPFVSEFGNKYMYCTKENKYYWFEKILNQYNIYTLTMQKRFLYW